MEKEIAGALNSTETLHLEVLGRAKATSRSITSVWTRVKWWRHGKEAIAADMVILENEKLHLTALQLTFLLK